MVVLKTKGLPNYGTTCYVNSFVQLITQSSNVRKAVLRHGHSTTNDDCFVCALKSVIVKIINFSTQQTDNHAKSLLDWIDKKGCTYELNTSIQCDPHQLFICLNEMAGFECFERLEQRQSTCLTCSRKGDILTSTFCEYEVNLMDETCKGQTFLTTQQLINQNSEMMVPDYLCESCGSRGAVINSRTLSPPQVMCILIKRYDNNHQKLQTPVELLQKLNLKASDNNEIEYSIVGAIMHHGTRIAEGHYTTVLFSKYQQWIMKDDSVTSTMERPTGDAYIVFYEKVVKDREVFNLPKVTNLESLKRDNYNQEKNNDETNNFKCDICKRKFKTKEILANHARLYHELMEDEESQNPPRQVLQTNGSNKSMDQQEGPSGRSINMSYVNEPNNFPISDFIQNNCEAAGKSIRNEVISANVEVKVELLSDDDEQVRENVTEDADDEDTDDEEEFQRKLYAVETIDLHRSIGRNIKAYYTKADMSLDTVSLALSADKICHICQTYHVNMFEHFENAHDWINHNDTHLQLLEPQILRQDKCMTCNINFETPNDRNYHKRLHLEYAERKDVLFKKCRKHVIWLPRFADSTTERDVEIMCVGIYVQLWLYLRKSDIHFILYFPTWIPKKKTLKQTFKAIKKPEVLPIKMYWDVDWSRKRIQKNYSQFTDLYKATVYQGVLDDNFNGSCSVKSQIAIYGVLQRPFVNYELNPNIRFYLISNSLKDHFLTKYLKYIDAELIKENLSRLLHKSANFLCLKDNECFDKDCSNILHLEGSVLLKRGEPTDDVKVFDWAPPHMLNLTELDWNPNISLETHPNILEDFEQQLSAYRMIKTPVFCYTVIPAVNPLENRCRRFNQKIAKDGGNFRIYVGCSTSPLISNKNMVVNGGSTFAQLISTGEYNTTYEIKRLVFYNYDEAAKAEACIQLLFMIYEKINMGNGSLEILNKRLEVTALNLTPFEEMRDIILLRWKKTDLFDNNDQNLAKYGFLQGPFCLENPPFYLLNTSLLHRPIYEITLDSEEE